MIGIWDLGFFLGFFLVTVGAVYFHWATATHGVRRRGSVGANYWGCYDTAKKAKTQSEGQGRFKLPKPSNHASTINIGKAPPGCAGKR